MKENNSLSLIDSFIKSKRNQNVSSEIIYHYLVSIGISEILAASRIESYFENTETITINLINELISTESIDVNLLTSSNILPEIKLEFLNIFQEKLPSFLNALEENIDVKKFELTPQYQYDEIGLNLGYFNELSIRTGLIQCIDPLTGNIIKSNQAWVMPISKDKNSYIAYLFNGLKPFVLLTIAHVSQAKAGIWFPSTGLFVAANIESAWIEYAVTFAKELREKIFFSTSAHTQGLDFLSQRKSVLYLGFDNNLGHHIWNELSGLEKVLKSNLFEHIHTINVGPNEFIPIDKVFPELLESGIKIIRWKNSLPQCILHTDSLPIRLTGNRVSKNIRQRIVAWALQNCREVIDIIEKNNDDSLILWINLRVHNKSWVRQIEGIEQIAKNLTTTLLNGKKLKIILDGTPDTTEIANQIRLDLDGVAEVLNATQLSIASSTALASLTDIFLCVVGSGLVMPHWLIGRRGVAHSNRPHLSQQKVLNNICEGVHDAFFIEEQFISDYDRPIIKGISQVNYDVDDFALFEALKLQYRFVDTKLRSSAVSQMLAYAQQENWFAASERIISI